MAVGAIALRPTATSLSFLFGVLPVAYDADADALASSAADDG